MKNFSLVPTKFTQVTVEKVEGINEKIKGLGLGINLNCPENKVAVVFPSKIEHVKAVEYLTENGFNVTSKPLDC